MKIEQMLLYDSTRTLDTNNDLTFVIRLPNDELTRWSAVNQKIAYRILDNYFYSFKFRSIYE